MTCIGAGPRVGQRTLPASPCRVFDWTVACRITIAGWPMACGLLVVAPRPPRERATASNGARWGRHGRVATNELQSDKQCRDPGSNRGPSDLQSDALPTELSRLHGCRVPGHTAIAGGKMRAGSPSGPAASLQGSGARGRCCRRPPSPAACSL